MRYPKSIQKLIDHLTKLPSVGPKTAERYVFYLLNQSGENLQQLAQAIAELKEKTAVCRICNAVSETDPCEICRDRKRDGKLMMIVANTRDMLVLEGTREYNGYYHILGGVIDTISGVGPEKLRIKELVARVKKNRPEEIVLALNPTVEGETTVLYLSKLFKPYKITISRLARGLPAGSDLEYADQITLSSSFKNRNIL